MGFLSRTEITGFSLFRLRVDPFSTFTTMPTNFLLPNETLTLTPGLILSSDSSTAADSGEDALDGLSVAESIGRSGGR